MHTPGPWMVDETNALGAYGVWTDYATHPGHDGAGYGTQICSVTSLSFSLGHAERRSQRDANARLIAAAPDLLAACEDALRCLTAAVKVGLNFPPDEVREIVAEHAVLKELRTAIAKAKGR